MDFGVGGLNLALVEHWLEGSRPEVVLAVKVLDLQKVMAVIYVIGDEIADKLLDDHPFLVLKVGV
jgi:hypothetical protein